ncbi:MAG: hypothetical protein KBS81_08945 [Spirochaetales bacterium]|nr:hypothetical protein [Candidatus Physcosoma equi]
MKKILVLALLLVVAVSATFASGIIEGIKYPVVTVMPTEAPAAEPQTDLAAAVEAVKAEPAAVVEAPAAVPAPVAPVVEAPVAEAPAFAAKAFAAANSAAAQISVADFVPTDYWKQIACAPEMADTAAALVGECNVVVLASEAAVVANVANGLFLIGILPADAATPEGCIAQVVNK